MLPTLLTLFACSTGAGTSAATDTGATDSADTGATDTGTACDTADTSAATTLPACDGTVYPCELAFEAVAGDHAGPGVEMPAGVSNCTPLVWPANATEQLTHLTTVITDYAGPSGFASLPDVPVDWDTKSALVTAIRCSAGNQIGFSVDRIVARSRTSVEIQYSAAESVFTDGGSHAGWDVYTIDKVAGMTIAHAQADITLY